MLPKSNLSKDLRRQELYGLLGDLPDRSHKIDDELRQVYQKEGIPEAWKLIICDTGHYETSDMRIQILRFLQKRL